MPTTNFFHLNINDVSTGKFKTYLFSRSRYSKVGHRKVYKVLGGIIIHGTVILHWTEIVFESEDNVPHVVHRWRDEFLKYQFVICHQLARMVWECVMLSHYNKAT